MGASFSFDRGGLESNIRQVPPKLMRAVTGVADLHATRGENAMRKNAPWRDRTTNARNGLHTRLNISGKRVEITFAHGVSYGIWLEVRWAGRYQIIMPTVLSEGRSMMKTINKLMGKM